MSIPEETSPFPSAPLHKGIHFDFIKNTIPDHYLRASPERRQALKNTAPHIPDWYDKASQAQKDILKLYNEELGNAQNERDKLFARLKSAERFASELLIPELKKLDSNFDPDDSWLRLYSPTTLGIFGIKTGRFQVKTFSLLQAALHNFEDQETEDDFYDTSSCFITRPNERGHFERLTTSVTVQQFTRLCRRLDIGQRYQTYLNEFLRPDNAFARSVLRHRITEHQKSALKAAAYLALLKKDIGPQDFNLLLRVVKGEQKIMEGDKQVYFRGLRVMGLTMNNCIVFSPTVRHRYHEGYVIAYIPDDPEHPVKRYESFTDFRKELTRKLKTPPWPYPANEPTAYQRFLSRFVPQRHKPYFFSRFTDKVLDGPSESFATKWQRHELVQLAQDAFFHAHFPPPPDIGSTLQAQDDPNFNINRTMIKNDWFWEPYDLWAHLHDSTLEKLISDARVIAVPNADEDAKSRANRFANYLNIGMIALGVFAPFVPGLGEVMLVVMAGQLLYETLEGAIELSEGDRVAGWAHLTDVIENIATAIVLAPVFHYTVSPFVEGLKAVRLSSGETRLWKPDLAPYRYDRALPSNAVPDASGVYRFDGKSFISLEGKLYEVRDDGASGKRTIVHPQRAGAYEPELLHNNSGAHVFEGEQPRTWDDTSLMRRLGPSVEGLSDSELEHARRISGVNPDQLRRVYVDNEKTPALLDDQLMRLNVDNQIEDLVAQLKSDDPGVYNKAEAIIQLHLMTRYGVWPDRVSMRIMDTRGQTLWEYTSVKLPRGRKLVVQLQEHQINSKTMLETIVQTLEYNAEPLSIDGVPLESRLPLQTKIDTVRKHLGKIADRHREELFKDYLETHEGSIPPAVELIRQHVPEIPINVARRLLDQTPATDQNIMSSQRRLPLRVKGQARDMSFEARANHAREGFYRPSMMTADTERMTLGALRFYSDSFAELRIEVRQQTLEGQLRASAGAQDAPSVRILVRNEQGQYALKDPQNNLLHPATDLYEGILRALPDNKRQALGYQVTQGDMFKQWIMAKTEPPAVRRTVLAEPPFRRVADRETLILLRGPGLSKQPESVEQHIQELYPHMSEREVAVYAESLRAKGDPIELIRQEQQDLQALRQLLNDHQHRQTQHWGPDRDGFVHGGGLHIAERLIECFERKAVVFGKRSTTLEGGYALDLSSEINPINLERWWKKMPDISRYLERVSALNLDNTRVSEGTQSLLADFRYLRQLSAQKCNFIRLPQSLNQMRLLETLRLTDNNITLTPEAHAQLRGLTRLQILRLDNNPLGQVPDVGRMPMLKVLGLGNTHVTRWPEGLFKVRRPRGFYLDLMNNPISEMPDVVPGSENARLVARTRLSGLDLSPQNRLTFQTYRRSVGISPTQTYTRSAESLARRFPISNRSTWWGDSYGLDNFRLEAWSDVEGAPDSQGFFDVIASLTRSNDYRAGGQARDQLAQRVWRMIDAMDMDQTLRDELFTMATSPTNCADAGAQLFNMMGIKVLVCEAYSFATSTPALERELVILAKGASRLEQVNEIAREDIRTRGGNPDEVEVYLAYQTSMADPLDLPWQSIGMLYRQTSGVTDLMIQQALASVKALEEGDGLVDNMLSQDFWERFLRDTHPGEFARNDALFENRSTQLIELKELQADWVHAEGNAKTTIRARLQGLVNQLSIDENLVFTDEEMSDGFYELLANEMGYERLKLGRDLTRAAMERAGL